MEAAKLTATAVMAIIRTARLPKRLPQTPLTKAPRSGIPMMSAIRPESFAGNKVDRAFMGRSVPEEIRLVRAHRALDSEEREHDCKTDCCFGRGDRDNEER